MAKAIAVATKTTGTKGTKSILAPELVEKLAKRWKAGEEMKTLAVEVKVTWPTLAGIFIAAGHRAKDRKKVKKTTAVKTAPAPAPNVKAEKPAKAKAGKK